MNQHVRLERSHEEERRGVRVFRLDHARFDGALEVVGDDAQAAPRRTVVALWIEGDDQGGLARALVHGHGDARADDPAHEGDESLGEPAEHDARILGGVGLQQLEDAARWTDQLTLVHRRVEEVLLGLEVAEDRRWGDGEAPGDVGEGRAVEAAGGECVTRGVEDLIAVDARLAAHLLVNVYLLTRIVKGPGKRKEDRHDCLSSTLTAGER